MLIDTAPTHEVGFLFGRFDPPHLAHKRLALELKKKVKHLLIGLGSYRCAPNIINPFSSELRKGMWKAMLPDIELTFFEVHDTLYNQAQWDMNFEMALMKALRELKENDFARHPLNFDKIACIGHKKKGDKSTEYLNKFKQKFDYFPLKTKATAEMNATDIRFGLFGHGRFTTKNKKEYPWYEFTDRNVTDYILNNIVGTPLFEHLQGEHNYIYNTYLPRHQSDYPLVAMTSDAVVTYGANVLVGKRKDYPAKGQLAFPGGFVHTNEQTHEGMLRELTEETGITLNKMQLKKLIGKQRIFADPRRDPRGRIYSHAFHIELDDTMPCPYPIGADDLEEAFFISKREFYERSPEVGFDHVQILDWFTHGGDDY